MKDTVTFVLTLLAALCAENIPLMLGLTLAAVLVMALPQILNRLGICRSHHRERSMRHDLQRSL